MSEYLNERDYLNKDKVRNKENTSSHKYNCGGLALGTYSWYHPYKEEDVDGLDDFVWWHLCEGFSTQETANLLAQEYITFMRKEFDNLRVIQSPEQLREGERLVCFRTMVLVGEDDDYTPDETTNNDLIHMEIETDFHFRYFEDGHWWEKCGLKNIENCDERMKNEDWECNYGSYNSRSFYLALTI